MPTMPTVTGLDSWAALQALVTAGVRVLPFSIFQDDPVTLGFVAGTDQDTPGFVQAQDPLPGASIAVNAPVRLTCFAFPMAIATPAGETNV